MSRKGIQSPALLVRSVLCHANSAWPAQPRQSSALQLTIPGARNGGPRLHQLSTSVAVTPGGRPARSHGQHGEHQVRRSAWESTPARRGPLKPRPAGGGGGATPPPAASCGRVPLWPAAPLCRALHKPSGIFLLLSPSFRRSVYVRVRPLNDAERERGAAWRVEGNSVFQVLARARLGLESMRANQLRAVV